MIDEDKLAQVQAAMAGTAPEKEGFDLDAMSVDELRELRDEIDRRLPEDSLDSLNLEKELVGQYRKTKDLMDSVLHDDETPANQRAQVANSVVTTLGQLVKLQEDLKREETLKLMETCLLEVLLTLPEPTKVAFFTDYERAAKRMNLL